MSLQGRNIAVVGMGVSGLASVRLALFLGADVLAVNSGNTEEWGSRVEAHDRLQLLSQESPDCQSALSQCDSIILSPGIARESEFLKESLTKGIEVISEIEFAYRALKNSLSKTKIISVTGTNGKTTTVTIIDLLARGAGCSSFLGGNIGTPLATYALEVLSNKRSEASLIILELSSFQLESMDTFKSDVAAILNISANHGERYERVSDYARAKFSIADNLDDSDNIFVGDLGGFEKEFNPSCNLIKLEVPRSADIFSGNVRESFQLIGEHNLSNLNFATKLLETVGVDWKNGLEQLKEFQGVSYRLQKRPSREGLYIFNDAKSTNWEASLTALKACEFSYKNLPISLILGGKLRGHGDQLESKLDAHKESISKVFLYGESGKVLLEEFKEKFNCDYFKTLDEVIKNISAEVEKGVILFSPAFPSFDLYENYVKRGEHFDLLISEYLER
ncbi:UDP-N-acetylmuramoyl-L-alanine--D-glutamate ligase [Halobacteriovorax marinus]|uniref:UDP-N-acetylmuramoyl-L-alanine--D-glutamate ligase n=1 Tax=Halobacteriovorax marinus TaxID=97084 RepID=UPI000BC34A67|nr:UDP-N-acetylmuramoyl-L-alanine--D-glutamate ligase [Halobacteriovorax marinus]ATH08346.1 UDP-N-acetylmuramoyl-L-alanine--D-glutamate ligase [Halobacteriovorax marinus]